MKKKHVIILGIVLIIVAISIFGIYNYIEAEGKKYEIEIIDNVKYYELSQDNKYGVIDLDGNIIIEPKFEEIIIPNPEIAVFVCYDGSYRVILNEKNEEILLGYNNVESIKLENIASEFMYEKSVLKYEENGKYGLIDFLGNKITNAIYDEISGFTYKEGELLVKQGEYVGIINIKGNNILDVKYEKIESDGYYLEETKYSKSGYIISIKTDTGYRYGHAKYDGEILLKPEYTEVKRVVEKNSNSEEDIYYIASKNGQYGILKNNKEVVKHDYQSIEYDKNNDIFILERTKEYGIANIEGEIVVPVEYDKIEILGIYIYAENNNETFVYLKTGEKVEGIENTAVTPISDSSYLIKSVKQEEITKYGLVDSLYNEIIEPKYSVFEHLVNDYYIVALTSGTKLGIIDKEEKQILEFKFDRIELLSKTELVYMYIEETKMTYIYTKNMKLICEMQNANHIEYINEKYIKIYNGIETKYFDKNGNEMKNAEVFSKNKLFATKQNEKWGFIDRDGNVVVEYIYEDASEFNEYGYASIKLDGKWGAIDESGNITTDEWFEFSDNSHPSFIGKYYKSVFGFGEVCYKK